MKFFFEFCVLSYLSLMILVKTLPNRYFNNDVNRFKYSRNRKPFQLYLRNGANQEKLYSSNYNGSNSMAPKCNCQDAYRCKNEDKSPQYCFVDGTYIWGVCCYPKNKENKLVNKKNILNDTIEVNLNEVFDYIHKLEELEYELHEKKLFPEHNTKEFSHQNLFGSDPSTLQEIKAGQESLFGFLQFSKSQNFSFDQISQSDININHTNLADKCDPKPKCFQIKYRLSNGTCNNLQDTSRGRAVSVFARFLPPSYADGITQPRRAHDKTELPNSRLLSLTLTAPSKSIENKKFSILLMQFGQFIDHDLTRTTSTRTHNNSEISCCSKEILANQTLMHPECFPIKVPPQDHFLISHSQKCINFVRSATGINPTCRFGPREQINQLSSYLDANNIYGSSDDETKKLREFKDGLLKIELINNEPFLPTKINDSKCQIPKPTKMNCFMGGDVRVNEVIDLVVLHTVWIREHNRIAKILSSMNSFWDDETIFQETRRIVTAEYQHIIYNEFLPSIIGSSIIDKKDLKLSKGYSNSYDPSVDSTILNEFATAAFRLHSIIHSLIIFNTPNNQLARQVMLREVFNNPSIIYENGTYEQRLSGLTKQPIENFDNFFSPEITNHLFQVPGQKFGLDLVALNIQRGRDHGIQSYVKYREKCGLSKISSFDDLSSVFGETKIIDALRRVYSKVEDIDLFVGGTCEKSIPEAVVGETFACIIAEQFKRLKNGDRFWYENKNLETAFTEKELIEIKKSSLARVLCDNSNIGFIQPKALLLPNKQNPKVNCDSILPLNLKEWKQL